MVWEPNHGFSPQPDRWQCGPFALKHALIMLGIMADENAIAKVAGTSPIYGTNEVQLGRAARKFHCDLLMERSEDAALAKRTLVEYLRQESRAWFCHQRMEPLGPIVKEEKGRFIVLDSYDEAVLVIFTSSVEGSWVYHMDDGGRDPHPVRPAPCRALFRAQTRARVSLARARFLRRPKIVISRASGTNTWKTCWPSAGRARR